MYTGGELLLALPSLIKCCLLEILATCVRILPLFSYGPMDNCMKELVLSLSWNISALVIRQIDDNERRNQISEYQSTISRLKTLTLTDQVKAIYSNKLNVIKNNQYQLL
jgi:hypothetical protein